MKDLKQNIEQAIKENSIPSDLIIGESLFYIIGHDFIFEKIEFGTLFNEIYQNSAEMCGKIDSPMKLGLSIIRMVVLSITRTNREKNFKWIEI